MDNRSISDLRQKISAIDANILKLVKERFDLALSIADLKKSEGLSIVAPDVERRVLALNKERARELGIEESFVEELTRLLIREASEIQLTALSGSGERLHYND